MSSSTIWHSMEVEEIADKLGVKLYEGLSVSEASLRLEQHGKNEIYRKERPHSFLLIFLSQFFTFTSIILAAIAITLLFVNSKQAIFVIGVLILSVLFRYIQQSRSEIRIRKIFEPLSFHTKVIRGGRIIDVQSESVIPGDLIVFESGDYIPADARLIKSSSLTMDESAITGESALSEKAVFVLPNKDAPISERANMVYGGSYVIKGKGIGIVVATGADLELNKISPQIKDNLKQRLETSIQTRLRYLSSRFAIVVILLALLMIGVAWLTGIGNIYEILTISFSIVLLSSIPMELLNVCAYSLISTAYDIFKKGAKIKRVGDLETLGKIDTLCTENRGYFTEEDAAVKRIFINGQLLERNLLETYLNQIRNGQPHGDESELSYNLLEDLRLFFIISGLVAKNKPDEFFDTLSNRVAIAIESIFEKLGLDFDDYSRLFQMVQGVSYSDNRRQRTIIVKNIQTNSHLILTLGDTQSVIESCSKIRLNGLTEPLEKEIYDALLRLEQYLKLDSASVFSVAYREIRSKPGLIRNEQHSMIFLGMLALEKHIKDDAVKNVEICKNAGIKLLTMTDDNPEDAFNDASLLGIVEDRRHVIDCPKISQTDFWNNEIYAEAIDRAKVFCKPTFEDKNEILSRLKEQKKHIAMTINKPEDLQLLKDNVDFSITIPSMASDVTVNTANLLVYENGFKAITDAIMLSKEAYYTLRNSIRWILSSVVGQLLTLLIGSIIHFIRPQTFIIPLSLSQIVWINLLVNILPSFALGKNSTSSEMSYTKSTRVRNLVLSDYRWDIVLRGIIIALTSLISFVFTTQFSVIGNVQTATCTTLILTQFITGLQCYKYPIRMRLRKRISMYQSLWITSLSCIAIHLALIYIPFIQAIVDMKSLTIEWFWIIPFCLVSILSIGLTK